MRLRVSGSGESSNISLQDPLAEERAAPCEWLTNNVAACWASCASFLSTVFDPPARESFSRSDIYRSYQIISLSKERLDPLTAACVQSLQSSSDNHQAVIRSWVEAAYKKAGINLCENWGGGMMDACALSAANRNINPLLLEAINELIPFSQTASSLKEAAIATQKPLSSLIYKKMD